MVELSTSRVFDVSDPVEAIEYDPQQCRLIVSSQHGNYAMYDVGKNGGFFILSFFRWINVLFRDYGLPLAGNGRLQ